MTSVHGSCARRYRSLQQAFEENLSQRDDVGASLALVADGKLIVDLWGGEKDPETEAAWEADTLVNVWSTTKGITAACFVILASRGQLSYTDKVAQYWPEFAENGKADVTVAMLLSHQGGLCGFADPTTLEQLYDATDAARRLASMKPLWRPGHAFGYHAITAGYLANELFLRVEKRSIRQFVEQELRGRHGMELFIGLPTQQFNRAATMVDHGVMDSDQLAPELNIYQQAALMNPPISQELPNTSAWRAAEIPSANGFATARALAELYGCMAGSGIIGGTALFDPEVVAAAAASQVSGTDLVMGENISWGCGFLVNSLGLYGPNPKAFGHSGWGGSFAFADPDRRIAMAYTMNRMGADLVGDPRNLALVNALYA